jgi:toxin ParE1/3/4
MPRIIALTDINEAINFYRAEASAEVAMEFVNSLEFTFRSIARSPGAGSQRFQHELGIPGLRSFTLKRYPYVVFYVEHESSIDVWRVLHGKRDLAAWLTES